MWGGQVFPTNVWFFKGGIAGKSDLGILGAPIGESHEYSGRPALQSSNKTVNQLKLDTNKASEFNYWINIRFWGRSIVLDRSRGLIRDL